MKFTKEQLLKYARLYEEKFPKDVVLEDKFRNWFKNKRYLDKKTFLELSRWKTKRQTKNYLRNSEQEVIEITGKTLRAENEEVKMRTLIELRGVLWAVASVILHFAFPNQYPILDFRDLWSLKIPQPKSYNLSFLKSYVGRFRKLAKETGLSGREIDRGLWMYSKLNQKP